jgi:hypothetical protein
MGGRHVKKLLFGHLVYLYTPLGVIACGLGILKGGNWVGIGLAIFVINILIDTLTSGIHIGGAATDNDGEPAGSGPILNLMMYVQLLVFVVLQLTLASLKIR